MQYVGGDDMLVYVGLLVALGGFGAALQAAVTWRDGAILGFGGAVAAALLLWAVSSIADFSVVTAVDPEILRTAAIYGAVLLILLMVAQSLIEAVRAAR